MTKQLYELEFNERELGRDWMNIHNLKLCLYGAHSTRPELVSVRAVKSTWMRKLGYITIALVGGVISIVGLLMLITLIIAALDLIGG